MSTRGSSLFQGLTVQATSRGVCGLSFDHGPGAAGPSVERLDLKRGVEETVGLPESEQVELRRIERAALDQLREYLEGRRASFDLPLDLRSATPFRKAVLEELLTIPFGETISYGEIGSRIGCPSARAVGQAVGWNPIPIIIPCHRVVTRDGRLGGFSGGLDRKVALLALEGVWAEGMHFRSPIAASA